MRRSVRVVVAATVALFGLGQSPAGAGPLPPTPGIGANICDGFTGTCTNPIFVRPVVFYAERFSPAPGGPYSVPQAWTLGRLKVAEAQDDLLIAGTEPPFAVGHLRVRPFATGFVSVSTVGFGKFVNSNNPSRPYLFEGVVLTHDPDALRGQDFEFIGKQTGPVPPEPQGQPGQ